MQRIEWSEEFEIGIRVIDDQHRRIVEYINALVDIRSRGETDGIELVIESLIDYTFSHFAFEESLMEEAGYEYLTLHQSTHEAFTQRLNALKKQFNEGIDISTDLVRLLQTWLFDHIMHDDQSYAPLVKQKFLAIKNKDAGNWLASSLRRFFG